jgi:hypothetical protein
MNIVMETHLVYHEESGSKFSFYQNINVERCVKLLGEMDSWSISKSSS